MLVIGALFVQLEYSRGGSGGDSGGISVSVMPNPRNEFPVCDFSNVKPEIQPSDLKRIHLYS